jgi:hypothetical protein
MDCKKIFNLLDYERKINFKNRSELSDKLEFPSKQGFHIFMKRLETNKPNNQFNRICEFLEKLGYEIIIKKKGE